MLSAEARLSLVVPFYTNADDYTVQLLAEVTGERQYPALETLLTCSDRVSTGCTTFDSLLCSLFGIDTGNGIPYAALGWLADTGKLAGDDILRADPVHLHPDMEHVLLLDNEQFSIDDDEASVLVESLNQFLEQEGWRIVAPTAKRWYLYGVDSIGTTYTPVDRVRGENILPHMPGGKLQKKWRQVLNEIQMLLHAHEVNERRERQGVYTINAIWPWGNGDIQITGKSDFTASQGDSVLTRGLSLLTDTPFSEDLTGLPAQGNTLVVLKGLNDISIDTIRGYLNSLEQDWAAPIVKKLRSGSMASAQIYITPMICYTVTGKSLRRWWRRKKSLNRFFGFHANKI